jgi:uncharacterized protein YbjT (DUF2867 family)
MSTILVTGGTGTLGAAVAAALTAAGHRARVGSRRDRPADGGPGAEWARMDYRGGGGLAAALAGVDAVVHCANQFRGGAAMDQALVSAARAAAVPHLVHISIVGVDQVPFSYYRGKLAGEQVVAGSGVPWTLLRATQFHDLLASAADTLLRPPVTLVPTGLRFQPVAVTEVAARLAELAVAAPAGRVPDLGGPQVREFADLLGAVARQRGRRRVRLPVSLPVRAYRTVRDGGLCLDEDVPSVRGTVTFEQFLATGG